MLSLCAIILVGLDLLSGGNHSLVGAAIGLKYVFIDEFLPVFVLICFLVCCKWLLELLGLCIVGESIIVVLLLGRWGNIMINVAPTGLAM